jgi:copper transport protein
MTGPAGRVRARRGLLAAAALVAALAVAPAAGAHAMLTTTEPANDAVLEQAPREVILRFNESVESSFGNVRVYDSQARRVDRGRVERPDGRTITAPLAEHLARGTYTVTWRVTSADSHPISGAFVFHVDAPGANPAGIAAQVLDDGTPRTVSVLFTVVRFLDFVALFLVVGGAVALAAILRGSQAGLRRALAVAGVALAVCALLGIVLQGAAAGGLGLRNAASWDSVRLVLETQFGRVWLVQGLLGLVVAAFAVSGLPALALLVPAVLLVPTPSLSGHARVSGGLSLVSDIVHVAGGAVWAGSLAFLAAALAAAGARRWALAADAVPRFSRLAVWSVAALLVAGVVNGYAQVGAWRGLWDTTYGLLLLAKVALVLPLLALGAYNNRRAVPRLRDRIASVAERRRFLRTVLFELALVVAVVGLTAVLVTEPPARASVAPRGPSAEVVPFGELELNLVVDPAVAGANDVHLYLTDRSGQPADVDELRLSATLASRQVGPLRFTARRLAPGHYTSSGVQLALAGDWQLRVEARRGEFEASQATLSIPIRKGS